MFGVFRVKNHGYTQKNHIFSNFRPASMYIAKCLRESFYHNFTYILPPICFQDYSGPGWLNELGSWIT
jgi:hypothetical protein